MKLTLDFHNHFSGHDVGCVEFVHRDVQSHASKLLLILFNTHAQSLFNYGMHLCADDETVKASMAKLFIDIEKKGPTLIPYCTENKLFKHFREILKCYAFKANGLQSRTHDGNLSCDVNQPQAEAIFLRLHCQFTYEEIASIMCMRKESVRALVNRAIVTVYH